MPCGRGMDQPRWDQIPLDPPSICGVLVAAEALLFEGCCRKTHVSSLTGSSKVPLRNHPEDFLQCWAAHCTPLAKGKHQLAQRQELLLHDFSYVETLCARKWACTYCGINSMDTSTLQWTGTVLSAGSCIYKKPLSCSQGQVENLCLRDMFIYVTGLICTCWNSCCMRHLLESWSKSLQSNSLSCGELGFCLSKLSYQSCSYSRASQGSSYQTAVAGTPAEVMAPQSTGVLRPVTENTVCVWVLEMHVSLHNFSFFLAR